LQAQYQSRIAAWSEQFTDRSQRGPLTLLRPPCPPKGNVLDDSTVAGIVETVAGANSLREQRHLTSHEQS
jgi:hypothetical protein